MKNKTYKILLTGLIFMNINAANIFHTLPVLKLSTGGSLFLIACMIIGGVFLGYIATYEEDNLGNIKECHASNYPIVEGSLPPSVIFHDSQGNDEEDNDQASNRTNYKKYKNHIIFGLILCITGFLSFNYCKNYMIYIQILTGILLGCTTMLLRIQKNEFLECIKSLEERDTINKLSSYKKDSSTPSIEMIFTSIGNFIANQNFRLINLDSCFDNSKRICEALAQNSVSGNEIPIEHIKYCKIMRPVHEKILLNAFNKFKQHIANTSTDILYKNNNIQKVIHFLSGQANDTEDGDRYNILHNPNQEILLLITVNRLNKYIVKNSLDRTSLSIY